LLVSSVPPPLEKIIASNRKDGSRNKNTFRTNAISAWLPVLVFWFPARWDTGRSFHSHKGARKHQAWVSRSCGVQASRCHTRNRGDAERNCWREKAPRSTRPSDLRISERSPAEGEAATGDGMALVFSDSAESPVECALEIREALKTHSADSVADGYSQRPGQCGERCQWSLQCDWRRN